MKQIAMKIKFPNLINLFIELNWKYFFYFVVLSFSSCVLAGPPFITDDPNPVSYQHENFYFFSTIDKVYNGQLITLPGFQFDYGIAPNLEITTIVPFVFQTNGENTLSSQGLGDINLGLKYALLLETINRPQLAFSPILIIPTGNANKGLGNGGSQLHLPLWVQKSWNDWISYGGGGYALNSAPNMSNSFFGGCVLQRQINDKLMLGGEIFSQSAISNNYHSYLLLSVGGSYNITPTISTLFSISHNVIGMEHLVGYLGLTMTI
ncbi:transporter [Legionella rowbothamii]|uniref:transporter n=1 Tax=Legionella rowbothamii TaxID=96229 RepID=UPI0010544E67|nr:transporter [Legionella rowbothamii]